MYTYMCYKMHAYAYVVVVTSTYRMQVTVCVRIYLIKTNWYISMYVPIKLCELCPIGVLPTSLDYSGPNMKCLLAHTICLLD